MQRCSAEYLVFKLKFRFRGVRNLYDPILCKLNELTARPSAVSYSKVNSHTPYLICNDMEETLHSKFSFPQHPRAHHAWGIGVVAT